MFQFLKKVEKNRAKKQEKKKKGIKGVYVRR